MGNDMNIDLSRLDATAQATLVASGELSALELVDAAIARIEKIEPRIHALASTDFDAARARAATKPKGAFGGVPFLVKDLLAYPGQRHAMGSRLFRANVAAQGSPFTDRLDACGLVTLGKTTTSELGLLGSTETLLSGITHNPWDLGRSATGSSGGSAAAVASGMVPMAHASDGGGSIRIPASACGLFGLKPGRGRALPAVPAGQADLFGLLIEHCVSRSVRDSARLLAELEDEKATPRVGFVQGPSARRLRIGVYRETLLGAPPAPETAAVLDKTVALCRELGHELVETAAPAIDGAVISEGFFTLAGAGMASLADMMGAMLGRAIGADDLEPFTLSLIEWYRALPAGAVERTSSALTAAAAQMVEFVARFDVVLCPTTGEAPPLGHLAPTLDRETLLQRMETLAGYTPIHNIAGIPAMSVPLFRSSAGLPIGSHFAANACGEAALLGLAYELEAAAPWAGSYPVIAG
jgi:amidase